MFGKEFRVVVYSWIIGILNACSHREQFNYSHMAGRPCLHILKCYVEIDRKILVLCSDTVSLSLFTRYATTTRVEVLTYTALCSTFCLTQINDYQIPSERPTTRGSSALKDNMYLFIGSRLHIITARWQTRDK